jgi:hypothetical protein
MAQTKVPSSQVGLLSNVGVITFSTTSNFTTGNNALGSAVTVNFPAGVTKALVVGQLRMQAQTGTQNDAQAWVGMDGATSCLRQNVIFTQGQANGTFTSSTCSVVSDVSGITAGNHTFQVYATASASTNCGACTILVIPMAG